MRPRGVAPLLDLALFTHRTYALGSVVAFIYGIALFGSSYLLPVYMQLALELPAAHAGTVLLPSGLVLAVVIGIAGRLNDRVPTYRMVSAGLALLAASFALMPTIGPGGLALLTAWTILGRVGLGLILPSLNIGAMRGLPRERIPQAASAINFLRMLGGAAGVSLCAVVLEWRVAAHGDSLARPATSPERLLAFNESFLLLAAVCALAMIAAWRMRAPVTPPAAGE